MNMKSQLDLVSIKPLIDNLLLVRTHAMDGLLNILKLMVLFSENFVKK